MKILLVAIISIGLHACEESNKRIMLSQVEYKADLMENDNKWIFAEEDEFPPFFVGSCGRRKSASAQLVIIREANNSVYVNQRLGCNSSYIGDTINIVIGYSTPFHGNRVNIKLIGNQFITSASSFSDDALGESMDEPMQRIEFQKLILTKQRYVLGDSLYGYVNARIAQTDGSKVYITGYFRTRIGDADCNQYK